jgi:hypothetical protein
VETIKKHMKKQKEVKLSAIMFKVSERVKDDLRREAKRQTEIRGYKVTMTALFVELVSGLRQSA